MSLSYVPLSCNGTKSLFTIISYYDVLFFIIIDEGGHQHVLDVAENYG